MTVNFPATQPQIGASVSSNQAGPIRDIRSTAEGDPIDQARQRFLDEGEEQFGSGDLSPKGHELVKAVVNPGKPGAPGVQVSTFAVDGVQSKDMLVIKRVPPTADGPNFLVYMPEEKVLSFHEFNTAQEITEWVKGVAKDPAERARFADHFSNPDAPKQMARVSDKLGAFADGDINAVVGSFGYEKGDIFARLDKGASVPPAPVNGLVRTQLFKLEPDGRATYIGYREDGQKVLYSYDAYGNMHGSSGKDWYFVQNGLNENKPLEPMTLHQYTRKVISVSLDNVGANDMRGLLDEFLKQLRNPGHGLGTALKALGVPEDIANSIEEILKNPVTGTLLELNHDNRLGKLFGIDKETMDNYITTIGGAAQSSIPIYGTWRDRLNTAADTIEHAAGAPEEPTTEVRV